MASEILAQAAFDEGKYPQSFPAFGLERRGAPVAAFLRVYDRKIMLREAISRPDFIVVMDHSLLKIDATLSGLKSKREAGGVNFRGGLLISSSDPPDSFSNLGDFTIGTVPASDIALKHGLGTKLLPIINTTILGAVVKMTGIVSLESLLDAIGESITVKVEENRAGAMEAFDGVMIGE